MSFSRMKPLPKFLIIAAVVSGAVYGSTLLFKLKSPDTPPAPEVSPEAVAAEGTVPAAPSEPVAAVQAQPTVQSPPPAVEQTPDAGLAAVLGSKK